MFYAVWKLNCSFSCGMIRWFRALLQFYRLAGYALPVCCRLEHAWMSMSSLLNCSSDAPPAVMRNAWAVLSSARPRLHSMQPASAAVARSL